MSQTPAVYPELILVLENNGFAIAIMLILWLCLFNFLILHKLTIYDFFKLFICDIHVVHRAQKV